MTLENLARVGKVKSHKTTREEITRLLSAARRSLKDARLAGISAESKFDLAYKVVMQCALAALMANGFRPSTTEPGHHAMVIQSLPKTIGLPNERMIVLDGLRKKRNLSDYTGDEVSNEEARACLRAAEELSAIVERWLRVHQPALIR